MSLTKSFLAWNLWWTLAELAQGGRALELGIDTGRVALPLAESGVEVNGRLLRGYGG